MSADTTFPAGFDVTLLEPLLRDFVAVVGIANTLRLVEAFGGTRMWVPATVKEGHVIATMVGLDDARKLAAMLGGNRPLIPKALPAMRAARDAAIVANADGLSVPELARRYDLGERQVYNIRAAAHAPATIPATAPAAALQQQWHLFTGDR